MLCKYELNSNYEHYNIFLIEFKQHTNLITNFLHKLMLCTLVKNTDYFIP